MNESLRVRSYAKINWTLDVLFKREDGYHELRTLFQTISLYDTLRLRRTDGFIEISCNDPLVPCDETNLVHRAAAALAKETGIKSGASIHIEKRIPVGAGLGGGSSNAAATLLALCELWETNVEYRILVKIGASLGSDVPFFLLGGTAIGIGRGEEVYPTEQVKCSEIALVNPGFSVSTRVVYEKLSRLTRLEAVSIIPVTLTAANHISEAALSGINDLEVAALEAYPAIGALKTKLIKLGAKHALMSGSGGTVFGVFENDLATDNAVAVFRSEGAWAQRVRTVSRGEYRDTLFEIE